MRGAQLTNIHDMMPTQDIIWEGSVEKFAHYGRKAWRRVYMIIGQAVPNSQPFELGYNMIVALGSNKESSMIDFIPVSEIRDVLAAGQRASVAGRQGSQIWSKSQANLGVNEEQGPGLLSLQNLENEEALQDEDYFSFRILTLPNGHNHGRTYNLRCETEEACRQWTEQLKDARKIMASLTRRPSFFVRLQLAARKLHDSDPFQKFFMISILICFVTSMVSSEVQGAPPAEEGGNQGTDTGEMDPAVRLVFNIIDDVFTGIFVSVVSTSAWSSNQTRLLHVV